MRKKRNGGVIGLVIACGVFVTSYITGEEHLMLVGIVFIVFAIIAHITDR